MTFMNTTIGVARVVKTPAIADATRRTEMETIICDLDGTLANCEHRVHHVQKVDGKGLKRKPDWNAFYAGVRDDTVNGAVLYVLDQFMNYGPSQFEVIFCSGRPERCREDTVEWLKEECRMWEPPRTQLLMRKDGDFRADYIVKQEIYDTHIKGKNVLFVMDDRQQVVDMWRRNGLKCFQVAEGNF
jgi:hypothetical protein